jgi:hypothetical protein
MDELSILLGTGYVTCRLKLRFLSAAKTAFPPFLISDASFGKARLDQAFNLG